MKIGSKIQFSFQILILRAEKLNMLNILIFLWFLDLMEKLNHYDEKKRIINYSKNLKTICKFITPKLKSVIEKTSGSGSSPFIIFLQVPLTLNEQVVLDKLRY